ncbi:MAG: SigE family RNA polymerase sigma factor [Acidimicrobiia bacterium]|nr:SigE family RNA polymerase sigma factor [Acidimicrobiia bacterium]
MGNVTPQNWGAVAESVRVPLHFNTFYAEHYRPVVALVYTLTGSRWAAEDLAQEAFLTAHRMWDEVGRYESPGGWIRTVAVNLARSRFRRLGAETRALGRWFGQQPTAFPEMEDRHELFWRHVRRLPRRQAAVVALHYLEDISVADIAAVLGVAESSVKNSLAKARANLAERLSEVEVSS